MHAASEHAPREHARKGSSALFSCAVLVISVILGACGSGSSAPTAAPTTEVATTATTTMPTTEVATTTVASTSGAATEAIDGATAYLRRCGGCHGAEGTAQGADTLAGVGTKPEEFVRLMVEQGGGGGMPAFGEWLEPAEIDAIIAYVRASF